MYKKQNLLGSDVYIYCFYILYISKVHFKKIKINNKHSKSTLSEILKVRQSNTKYKRKVKKKTI